ncbi:MAG: hypothetical protein FWD04_09410 [Conexibacteraceae bacterium]|nr:hypothetical protein [Conexibacteraceae bacterium]
MRTLSRKAAAPEDGWFQIGEVPEQTPPRHRGQGRVSLSASQHDPDTVSSPEPAAPRTPVLERANGAAASVLGRILDSRYGALALCASALLLVLILAVMVASRSMG